MTEDSLALLHQVHRQQLRTLQSRITQKKKSATKKSRKGIDDECTILERELQEQHQLEIATHESSQAETDQSPITEVQTSPSTASTAAPTDQHQQSPGPYKEAGEEIIPQQAAIREAPPIPTPQSSSTIQSPSPQEPLTSNRSFPSIPTPAPRLEHKPNRQKARLARRAAAATEAQRQAAAEASDLPDPRATEREAMRSLCSARGLVEMDIRPDGHCLYGSVADQLSYLKLWDAGSESGAAAPPVAAQDAQGEPRAYVRVRAAAADALLAAREDFEPFLEEPFEEHVRRVRETADWGGQPELLALARAFGVDVNVLTGNGRVEAVRCGGEARGEIWLAYLRHSYGLGAHYNSLRRAESRDDGLGG